MKLALLLLLLNPPAPIDELDRLAKARDVEGVKALASEGLLKERPQAFRFFRSGGTYGTGRFGWTAKELRSPDGRSYIVFGTKITSQDIGEQVFEWRDGKLTAYVDEQNDWGYRITNHDFDISFKPAEKTAILSDRVTIARREGAEGQVLLRMSPQYVVSSISDGNREVPFQQASGVLLAAAPVSKTFTYRISYSGVVNLPQYAGSINSNEALLTNDYWYPMIARKPATFTARVRAPKGWTVVTQGDKVGEQEGPDGKTFEYKMGLPVVYFSLSAGPFRTGTDVVAGRQVHTFTTELSDAQMK
ncbi:MAG TPA: hypothetical protein VEX38_05060, partial [Fimbriimonadaceae bacterium]|nr:hypothetical protein [Fimbriimonadaceae bacterium]